MRNQCKWGETVSYGSFTLTRTSSHKVTMATEHFSFDLNNSDLFINLALTVTTSLAKLSSHGLLGQTHSTKVYPTSIRYIEGSTDDYIIDDDDIFGTDFVFNQFSLKK